MRYSVYHDLIRLFYSAERFIKKQLLIVEWNYNEMLSPYIEDSTLLVTFQYYERS